MLWLNVPVAKWFPAGMRGSAAGRHRLAHIRSCLSPRGDTRYIRSERIALILRYLNVPAEPASFGYLLKTVSVTRDGTRPFADFNRLGAG